MIAMTRRSRTTSALALLAGLLAGCAAQDFDPSTAVLPANRMAADAVLEVHLVAAIAPGGTGAVPGNRAFVEYNVKLVNKSNSIVGLQGLVLRTAGGDSVPAIAPEEVTASGKKEARERGSTLWRRMAAGAATAGSAFFPGDVKPAALIAVYGGAKNGTVTVNLNASAGGAGGGGVKTVTPGN